MPGDVVIMVAPAELVGEQHGDVEGPRGERDVLPGEPGRDLVVEPEDQEDLEGRETVERNEVEQGEGVVVGGALLQAGGAALALLRRGVDGVPHPAEERVHEEEGGHVGQVASEGAVLGIGVVDLASKHPAVGEVLRVLFPSRVLS